MPDLPDCPRAWEIARATPDAKHHPMCAFTKTAHALLCDCDVLTKHPDYRPEWNDKGARIDYLAAQFRDLIELCWAKGVHLTQGKPGEALYTLEGKDYVRGEWIETRVEFVNALPQSDWKVTTTAREPH